MSKHNPASFIYALLSILGMSGAYADPAHSLPTDAYQRAEAVRGERLAPLGLNLNIEPVWVPGSERFWFKDQTAAGWSYVEVDASRRSRRSAFDHQQLATLLSKSGESADPQHLPLQDLAVLDSSGQRVSFTAAHRHWTCDLSEARCSSQEMPAPDPTLLLSPSGTSAVFIRDRNVWIKDLRGGAERQLTRDGAEHFEYGKMPDNALMAVLQASTGLTLPPYGITWSPDERHLVVTRVDERALPDYTFLQTIPADGSLRPKPIAIRIPLSADPIQAGTEVSVIDTQSSEVRKLDTGPDGLSPGYWWGTDSSHFLAVQGGDYTRKATVYEVNVETGQLRKILTEESRTFVQVSPLEYDEPAIRYLPKTHELIWFSQRDGWNHLYLVDTRTGRIKAQLGAGSWSVQNIVRLDERKRLLYFTAAGREAGQDPYFRHLYCVGLDGKGLRLLTPEAADHVFVGETNPALRTVLQLFGMYNPPSQRFSPEGRYFVDTWSSVKQPPVTALRDSTDGRIVMPLASADVTAIRRAGWIPPEPFQAKAADGSTDLYGLLFKPVNFDPSRRYPVIEHIYNGPQIVTTPHDFAGGLTNWMSSPAQSLAQLGFVVVVMDGRGTPMRSKAFQDYIYGNMQEFALEDHVAALKSLAARFPYMDLERLGVFGHSYGGYAAMKAILGYPKFYKVAVSSAGPYDMYSMYPQGGFFPPAIFRDGYSGLTTSAHEPTNWGDVDLTRQATQLQGKLLLAFGDLDENALPATATRMVNALIAANKEFDLIYLPNRSHAFESEPYFIRRTWDYFVRHLLQTEPPKDYPLAGAK